MTATADQDISHNAVIRAGTHRARLLEQYAGVDFGLTDYEAAAMAALTQTGYWKRCSDLRNYGLIEPNGEIRQGPTGLPSMVCQITKRGVGAAHAFRDGAKTVVLTGVRTAAPSAATKVEDSQLGNTEQALAAALDAYQQVKTDVAAVIARYRLDDSRFQIMRQLAAELRGALGEYADGDQAPLDLEPEPDRVRGPGRGEHVEPAPEV